MNFSGLASNPLTLGLLIFLGIQQTSQYIKSGGTIQELLIMVFAVLVSITFHEFAHAFVADRLGDETPRQKKRLTLNPLAHIDPIGLILLIFCHFGWGKPVPINSYNFKRNISMRKGTALVALAGPVMNFLLAIIFSVALGLVVRFASAEFLITSTGMMIINILRALISINVGLGVFNLIPLPPLDGSKILAAILPGKAREWYVSREKLLQIVFIIIWVTPLASYIISPAINWICEQLFNLISFIAVGHI